MENARLGRQAGAIVHVDTDTMFYICSFVNSKNRSRIWGVKNYCVRRPDVPRNTQRPLSLAID